MRTEFGRLDILVNNAGIRLYQTVDEASAESWDKILGINLISYAFCAKAAIPRCVGTRAAASSTSPRSVSVVAGGGNLQYDTTKAAMAG